MAATENRLAVAYIEAGDGEAALAALQKAEEFAESVPEHQDQLMQQTICESPHAELIAPVPDVNAHCIPRDASVCSPARMDVCTSKSRGARQLSTSTNVPVLD